MPQITVSDAKTMREHTGLGIIECKELLEKYGTEEKALDYLRSVAAEPEYVGMRDKERYDILKKGILVCSFDSREELEKSSYFNPLSGYGIRMVSNDGNYVWFK